MLRRLAALALALVCVAVMARPARAIPDGRDLLRTELELRRDSDFAGTLSKPAAKQLKAVTKSLTALGNSTDSIADELKNFTKIAKTLAKAFPVEFRATKASSNLRSLIDVYIRQVSSRVEETYDGLAAAVPSIRSAKLRDKADAARAAAREDLDLAAQAPDVLSALKTLTSAAKWIAKGLALAAKDPPL